MELKFPCLACGLCCRRAGTVPYLADQAAEDGVCSHLDRQTQRCTIYTRRPLICNIAAMYDACFKEHISEREYIRENLRICRDLIAQSGTPEQLRQIVDLFKKYEIT